MLGWLVVEKVRDGHATSVRHDERLVWRRYDP
jgi:hypothetical protein